MQSNVERLIPQNIIQQAEDAIKLFEAWTSMPWEAKNIKLAALEKTMHPRDALLYSVALARFILEMQQHSAPEGKGEECSMCDELAEVLKFYAHAWKMEIKELRSNPIYNSGEERIFHYAKARPPSDELMTDGGCKALEALAKYEARKQQPPETCPACNGNDRNAPCAYPGAGVKGCLRDKRLQQPPASESDTVGEHHCTYGHYPRLCSICGKPENETRAVPEGKE